MTHVHPEPQSALRFSIKTFLTITLTKQNKLLATDFTHIPSVFIIQVVNLIVHLSVRHGVFRQLLPKNFSLCASVI